MIPKLSGGDNLAVKLDGENRRRSQRLKAGFLLVHQLLGHVKVASRRATPIFARAAAMKTNDPCNKKLTAGMPIAVGST